MKSLTTSVYTFEKLIDGNFLYVDKTDYIYNIIKPAYSQYFLSRPRRFGKSLLISTLKAIFQGKKELFKGLALYDKSYEWKQYPILHFDFGNCDARNVEEFQQYLLENLDSMATRFGLSLTRTGATGRFTELIELLEQQAKVVILIDEYDKPILDNIDNDNVEEIRQVLEGFYSVIKSTEAQQRFVLMTGVSKFSKVSVFSKLNNLTDLTMDASFAMALGYTQSELEKHFSDYLKEASKNHDIGKKDFLLKIQEWYNGYRFNYKADTVYNPVSVGKFFIAGGEFHNYWFATGTPTFLLKLAKKQQFNFEEAITKPVAELAFEAYEIGKLQALPLLFQTGYLTIKSTEIRFGRTLYYLGFPNQEVEAAFEAYLLEDYSMVPKENVDVHVLDIATYLTDGDIDAAMEKLQQFFVKIPYDIQIANEKYYQTIFFVVFKLLGIYIKAEVRTNKGRIDAVAETEHNIHIFEFKLNGTAEEALKQIKDKDYYQKYQDSDKNITLVGANFNTKERSIDSWLTKKL